jgi:hypothetical protein
VLDDPKGQKKLCFYVVFLVGVTLGCIGDIEHDRRHFDSPVFGLVTHAFKSMDALNIPQFNWLGVCQENAGTSVDESLVHV